MFEEYFDRVGVIIQHKLIVSFLKEVTPLAISHTIGNCEYYNYVLVYTHTSLYQVLGLKNRRKFSKSTMWMRLGIQKYGDVVIYDFPGYLEENINEGLASLKKGVSIDFRWYSFLIHMTLFHNKDYFVHVWL